MKGINDLVKEKKWKLFSDHVQNKEWFEGDKDIFITKVRDPLFSEKEKVRTFILNTHGKWGLLVYWLEKESIPYLENSKIVYKDVNQEHYSYISSSKEDKMGYAKELDTVSKNLKVKRAGKDDEPPTKPVTFFSFGVRPKEGRNGLYVIFWLIYLLNLKEDKPKELVLDSYRISPEMLDTLEDEIKKAMAKPAEKGKIDWWIFTEIFEWRDEEFSRLLTPADITVMLESDLDEITPPKSFSRKPKEEEDKPPKPTQDWKNIDPNFTDDLKEKWINNGFTYEEVKDWINAGLIINNYDFAKWLKDVKNKDAEWVLNHSDITALWNEFNPKPPPPLKERKITLKNPEVFFFPEDDNRYIAFRFDVDAKSLTNLGAEFGEGELLELYRGTATEIALVLFNTDSEEANERLKKRFNKLKDYLDGKFWEEIVITIASEMELAGSATWNKEDNSIDLYSKTFTNVEGREKKWIDIYFEAEDCKILINNELAITIAKCPNGETHVIGEAWKNKENLTNAYIEKDDSEPGKWKGKKLKMATLSLGATELKECENAIKYKGDDHVIFRVKGYADYNDVEKELLFKHVIEISLETLLPL
jgi:hypothetical protein